jgi:hypothetical protein
MTAGDAKEKPARRMPAGAISPIQFRRITRFMYGRQEILVEFFRDSGTRADRGEATR